MGDAGEGLIDADSRIQERMDELELERSRARGRQALNREQQQTIGSLESLRLARTEMTRQLEATVHEGRRAQIAEAIEEIDRRVAELSARFA